MSKAIQFKNKSGEKIYPCPYYPIGSVYISVNSINPGTIFGGTWEQIKDRFLLACGNTYSNGSTGGESTHKLTVDEMPSHNHLLYGSPYGSADWIEGGVQRVKYDVNKKTASNTYILAQPVIDTGGSQAHNNVQPYVAVYMWKRIE